MAEAGSPLAKVGLTGGEPFLNRDLPAILAGILGRGHRVLVLTNAMKPMHRRQPQLLALHERYGAALGLRVSIDHFTPAKHEAVRGLGTWAPMLEGLHWLCANGFPISVASRTVWL